MQAVVLERRTTLDRLAAVRRRGVAGSAALGRVLDELDPRFHNHWERVLFVALRKAGVDVEPQVHLCAPSGLRCYLDLAIRGLRMGIEVDGFLSHMRRFAADRRRNNAVCMELRWELAHYAVAHLADRLDEVVAEVVRWEQVRRRSLG